MFSAKEKYEAMINIAFAVADAIVCIVSVVAIAYVTASFGKWWIILFSFIPVAMYANHDVVVETNVEKSRNDKEA